MRLVPKQLQRVGMTGHVPYYGGRLSPAQAYAASHPSGPSPGAGPPGSNQAAWGVPGPVSPRRLPPESRPSTDTLAALQHLLDTGVITGEEYEQIRARVAS
jgi:hypothetical protein